MGTLMSIIIPTYNRDDSLPKVLSKLLSQEDMLRDNNVEILVVDDGSTDRTREIADEFAEKFSLNFRYFHQENTGSASARNLGIKEAQGEILLFLDCDIIPTVNLVSEHLKFHKKYPQDNFALRGSTKTSAEVLDPIRIVEVAEVEERFQKAIDGEYFELCWGDFVSGNVSTKKQFLLENGTFDEEMIVLVDPELGYRLFKSGLRLFHSNKAMGFHFHPVSLDKKFRYAEKYGKSYAIWYTKIPDLKKELYRTMKFRKNSVFLYWKDPLKVLNAFLRRVLISVFTVKLFICMADISHGKLSRFLYKQVTIYYRQKAFRRHLALIRKGHVEINRVV